MEVIHDQENHEFKVNLSETDKAYLSYEIQGNAIDFQHTVVPPTYRGQGIAEKLVQNALTFVDDESSIHRIIPSCSYVAHFLKTKAPQYARYLTK